MSWTKHALMTNEKEEKRDNAMLLHSYFTVIAW